MQKPILTLQTVPQASNLSRVVRIAQVAVALAAATASQPTWGQEYLTASPQASGDAAQESNGWNWPWSRWTEDPPVGTAKWWKRYKSKAVFEQGKGYKVEGFEGHFDGNGRPLGRAVNTSPVPHPDGEKESKGLIPGLDPRAAYGKMMTAVGLGPDDLVAHKYLMEGEERFEAGK